MSHDGQARRNPRRGLAAAAALVALAGLVGGIVLADGRAPTPQQAAGSAAHSATVDSSTTDGSTTAKAGGDQVQPANLPAGLSLRAGKALHASAPIKVAVGKPLDDTRVHSILDRLPPLADDASLTTPFKWPTQSLTVPRKGTTVELPFPPKNSSTSEPEKPPASPKPLHVLRVQPQGTVAVVPFLSITFDQPMVPLSAVGQLTDRPIPVTISPKVNGTWSWIGTSTLRFAATSADADRLPMATSYTVTVPAGTTSVTGGTLAKAVTFWFDTPTPTVKSLTPTGKSLDLTPVFTAVFDQNVDPDAILGKLTVTADGKTWPIRLATAAEIADDDTASRAAADVPGHRVVAFRPVQEFPTDAAIVVTLAAGTPSAEGPRTTAKAATFKAHTYAALKLLSTGCRNYGCEPGSPVTLTFNNSLDGDAFNADTVTVSPEIPGGASITAYGNTIMVQGATAPSTRYTVTVAAGLRDVFGQKLAAPAIGHATIHSAGIRLDPFPQVVTTVDPLTDRQTVTVNTVNRKEFRERVFRVELADWATYRSYYLANQYRQDTFTSAPDWPVLVDRVVQIDGTRNQAVATRLDLTSELTGPDATHNVVVLIEPTATERFGDNDWQNRATMTWLQSTNLGVDALNDNAQLRVWVTDLRTGEPLPDSTVNLVSNRGEIVADTATQTDADGVAAMDLTGSGGTAVLVRRGDQTALLSGWLGDGQWKRSPSQDQLLWFVTDDRQTYRPGETVSIKGWVRRQSADVSAALTTLPADSTVSYRAYDSYGVQLATGKTSLSRLGGFDIKAAIPAGANLGNASIEFTVNGVGSANGSYGHTFTIADFRTPDFEVNTHGESALPYVVGNDLTVAADANYYAGGPLGDAPVDWQVRTAPATYAPPGWGTYTFGVWTPWWLTDTAGYAGDSLYGRSRLGYDMPCCGQPGDDSKVETFSGTTDGNGGDYLQVRVGDLGKDYAGLPVTVTAQATVTDVNRQAIANTTNLLVHPADYYVGLAGDGTFVKQGTDMAIQAIATDIDGAATAGLPITIRAARTTTTFDNTGSAQTEGKAESCTVTSTTEPVTCTFRPEVAGTYRITATVTDKSGRTSRSQLTRWVSGPASSAGNAVQQQQLTLVPSQETYHVGDTAQVLVQSPITTGTGLATVMHNGIAKTMRFTVSDGSAVLHLPITEAELPGVTVSAEVVGTAPRGADTGESGESDVPRPAYATGEVPLQVSTDTRKLTVTAKPRQTTVAPSGSTTVDVTVADAQGKPVAGSEFELVVVDEAVLALGGLPMPDPLQIFYPQLNNYLETIYGRAAIMLSDPTAHNVNTGPMTSAAAASESFAGGSMATPEAAAPQYGYRSLSDSAVATSSTTTIAERTNFTPLAVFVPSATTDADGRAAVDVPLPDSLTRYRVLVVAVSGDDAFGSAESTITAGLPLTVRASGPAFLNFGDTLEFPVLVQNQTDAALITDVVAQTANLQLTAPAGQQVSVPAHGRVEVRFGMKVAQAGTARVRVAAVSGETADAMTVDLPVYTPTTTETVATYGTVGSGTVVNQPVTKPAGVFEQFGGLQVSTSSTALQELTDALNYLVDYDYDSSDALAAQIVAIASLSDVLQAFSAPGLPSPERLKAMVSQDITELLAMQNDDGGFPYWEKGKDSEPFNSIEATQALLIAKKHGFDVNSMALQRAAEFLGSIDQHIPARTSQSTRDLLHAYALNVRMLGGHRDANRAESLATTRGTALSLDAVAWLLPVVADSAVRDALLLRLTNAAVDDAGAITFTNRVTDDAWTTLQSDRRTDGLVLDALLAVQPDNDMIVKIVNGLLSARTSGRWLNVQENSVILLALRNYYDTFESTTPDFVARVWIGGRFAGEHDYQGHTTERATVDVPTAQVLAGSDADVTLQNDGTGRLYYRIGMQTAPTSLALTPLDRGFVVARSYQPIDDPKDVTRDDKGVWHIKAGARVKVTLQLVSRSARTHVALIDPLPAGLQVLNPELATTPKDLKPSADTETRHTDWWWYSTWYDHQNLRDDRAEAFASWLNGGVYDYSYVARATTVGTFVAPPTRAEQIYAPETFGRSGSDRVVVQD